jgi:hypothetical protein
MTATLWLDTPADETLELGGTLQLYAAFAEMAHLAGEGYLENWPDLFGVLTQVELQEDADSDWLVDVRAQASQFLDSYGPRLSEHSRWVLEQLGGGR